MTAAFSVTGIKGNNLWDVCKKAEVTTLLS